MKHSVFDFFDIKNIRFKFGNNIAIGYKMPRHFRKLKVFTLKNIFFHLLHGGAKKNVST